MKAEQYLMKAELLLKKHDIEKVIETLQAAITAAEQDDDFIELVQSHCFYGEVLFMQRNYAEASKHLSFLNENIEKAEEYDDLLNDEIFATQFLLSMIERYT